MGKFTRLSAIDCNPRCINGFAGKMCSFVFKYFLFESVVKGSCVQGYIRRHAGNELAETKVWQGQVYRLVRGATVCFARLKSLCE